MGSRSPSDWQGDFVISLMGGLHEKGYPWGGNQKNPEKQGAGEYNETGIGKICHRAGGSQEAGLSQKGLQTASNPFAYQYDHRSDHLDVFDRPEKLTVFTEQSKVESTGFGVCMSVFRIPDPVGAILTALFRLLTLKKGFKA
jgi:hypothetical protein